MATGVNTYGTVAGIERLIGDLVASRTFGTGTTPTLAQVEQELDNVAAEINNALDMAGYTVPVSNANFPTAYAFVKASNEYGAAARLLAAVPHESYDPESEADEGRVKQYEKLLQLAIKRIEAYKIRADMRKRRLARVFAGSQQDDDSNDKVSLFTRDMDSNPLTGRTLIE